MIFKRLMPLFLAVILLFSACGPLEDPELQSFSQPAATSAPAETSVENMTETAPQTAEAATAVPEDTAPPETSAQTEALPEGLPEEGEYYYDVENVVLYLELYGELPPNYITKDEARKLGWEGGSVEDYKDGAAIGGDVFGNREGILPEKKGRVYTECDIDTDGYYSRGSRRLVYSDDGLYFYTSDHYETFSEVSVTEDYEVIW